MRKESMRERKKKEKNTDTESAQKKTRKNLGSKMNKDSISSENIIHAHLSRITKLLEKKGKRG